MQTIQIQFFTGLFICSIVQTFLKIIIRLLFLFLVDYPIFCIQHYYLVIS